MPLIKTRPPASLLVVLLLATLLPLLAAFQYSWLEQLKVADQYRRTRYVNFNTFRVGADFDRELAHIFQTFQVDADEGPPAQQIGMQYGEWVNNTQFPSLIDRVHWTVATDDGLRVEQFNGTDHLVELDGLPEDLADVEKALWRYALDLQRYWADREANELPEPVNPLWDEVPALVVQQLWLRNPAFTRDASRPLAWIVVALSEEAIRDEVLPSLASQAFSSDREPEYVLAVTDLDDPDQLIYASTPGLGSADFSQPDRTAELFSLRAFDFPAMTPRNRRYWNHIGELAEPRWQLLVRHEAGSLEAAVAAVRNRNMAISFGVLLLLGGSVLMIVASTRRAQRLAEQQIEFVTGITHELRTPLTVIRSAGENLADVVVAEPERTRKYGQVIIREGRRLSDMVERVLLFSRIQSGHQQYDIRPVDIAAVIGEALESGEALAAERSIAIATEIPDDLPTARADARALKSALQNLLSNAVKYSPRGSSVRLQVRRASGENGPEIQVAVEDQGTGIPASEQRAIFQPFYRGRKARDAQIEGSGLGLSLVKQIMEAQGGRVSVRSAVGRGSTFVLHLPLQRFSES